MANAKIFKINRGYSKWLKTINLLGMPVCIEPEDAEISIVLDGRYENPLAVTGKKVLVYDKDLWGHRWELFEPVLSEYYDKMVDVTRMSSRQKADIILKLGGE